MTGRGPGQVLFEFVRHWSRRSSPGDDVVAEQGRHVLVTEAVHSLDRRGFTATVNAIAREVGIDQSGASRLIKKATEAGYLAIQAPKADGRQRQVTITSTGRTLLEQAHEWQERVFDELTEGWSERRRLDFQTSMTDLIHRSFALEK